MRDPPNPDSRMVVPIVQEHGVDPPIFKFSTPSPHFSTTPAASSMGECKRQWLRFMRVDQIKTNGEHLVGFM